MHLYRNVRRLPVHEHYLTHFGHQIPTVPLCLVNLGVIVPHRGVNHLIKHPEWIMLMPVVKPALPGGGGPLGGGGVVGTCVA